MDYSICLWIFASPLFINAEESLIGIQITAGFYNRHGRNSLETSGRGLNTYILFQELLALSTTSGKPLPITKHNIYIKG
ncbi:hypothetical protein BC941DRAFT_424455 [Chlamydoabsidia padenii]|nr:hypothetical protein BC941DRAFT_424455 [Chlamydoabsidia padenii]